MNKKSERKPWEHHKQVLVFFIKHDKGRKSVLLGTKKDNSFFKEAIVAPGGKIEKDDLGKISAAWREGWQEAGLRGKNARSIARLNITIWWARRKITVHVVKCTNWSGRLRVNLEEFKNLSFIPFDKIPWDRLVPGDEKWMKEVLLKGKCRQVRILCGESRHKLLSITTRPLR